MAQAKKSTKNQVAREYRQAKLIELGTQLVTAELQARQLAKMAAEDEAYQASADLARRAFEDLQQRVQKLAGITDGPGVNNETRRAMLTEQLDGNLRAIHQNQELLDNAELYWSEVDRDQMVETHKRNLLGLRAAHEAAREMLDELKA